MIERLPDFDPDKNYKDWYLDRFGYQPTKEEEARWDTLQLKSKLGVPLVDRPLTTKIVEEPANPRVEINPDLVETLY